MAYCLLDDFGVLRFRGPDTQKFLQGQLSNDIELLKPGVLLRAGLHNPQGRTMALLAMLPASDGSVLAVIPSDLIGTVETHLKRYVLRAKVAIADESANYRVYGLGTPEDAPDGASVLYRYGVHDGDERCLMLQGGSQPLLTGPALTRECWRALDIAGGMPRVSHAVSAQFIAQMLNLDCIDAISFRKGCYTGQEVIARAHYRGRVKRRMQRFLSRSPVKLLTGASGRFDDGRTYRVVEATNHDDGRCEFLAVAPLPGRAHDQEESPDTSRGATTAVSALPLPYELPK